MILYINSRNFAFTRKKKFKYFKFVIEYKNIKIN